MVFDLETALKGLGNDKVLLYEALQDFVGFYGDAGAKVRDALHEERYTDVELLTHTLKGLGGTFASEALKNCALSLEQAVRAREVEEMTQKAVALDAVIGEMVADIKKVLSV